MTFCSDGLENASLIVSLGVGATGSVVTGSAAVPPPAAAALLASPPPICVCFLRLSAPFVHSCRVVLPSIMPLPCRRWHCCCTAVAVLLPLLFTWLTSLNHSQSTIFAALVQMLQPTALLLLMNTLPPLIRLLGMLEGFPAESRNQLATLSRYFYFQVGFSFCLLLLLLLLWFSQEYRDRWRSGRSLKPFLVFVVVFVFSISKTDQSLLFPPRQQEIDSRVATYL